MDLEKQKRNQIVRVVLTEILMVLAIIPIVIFLTLMAMGYRLGEDLSLEQSGLVQVNSLPNGATVKIDGENKFRTDASRMLAGGEHTLEISKDGFDSWSKKIEVTPGFLLRVRYPRLFRLERKAESVLELGSLRLFSAAPSRTRLLYQAEDVTKLQLVNIRNDDIKINTIDLSGVLPLSETGESLGTIGKIKWSWNSDAALMELNYADGADWLLVDMRENVPSRNLSRDFGLAITDVQFAGDSIERLYVLENGNLREVNLNNNGITKVLLANVEEFNAEQTVVGYIGKTAEKRTVGVYHNGADDGITIAELEPGLEAHVATSEYYGEKYLSYTVGSKLMIYEGESFPADDSEVKRMRLVISADLEADLNGQIIVSRTGEVILTRNDSRVVAVDLETNKYSEYDASAAIRFIDDYLLYGVTDGELLVWDFDGLNKRSLARGVADFGAVIAANNKWLYYVTNVDERVVLVREQIN